MIDNFEKIKELLTFDQHEIYHVSLIQRSKDGNDKSTRIIQDFYIKSLDYFEFIWPGIRSLCELYNARAYINLNGKAPEAILYKLMANGLERLKNKQYSILGMMPHCVAVCNGIGRKVWVVDIDEKISDDQLFSIYTDINSCRSSNTMPTHQTIKNGKLITVESTGYNNVITTINTPNGYHILTLPFNVQELDNKLEIKKNSPTLLYFNG